MRVVRDDVQVKLGGPTTDGLSLTVDGYQFPDAPDPAQRYSWHFVAGEARCLYGTWRFRWQALTCDESARVSKWLRRVADWLEADPGTDPTKWRFADRPGHLSFTEPNLRFRVEGETDGRAVVRVDLDAEFRPPWHLRPGRYGGDEYSLRLLVSPAELRTAAEEWDTEVASFPDLGGAHNDAVHPA
jgi:hypothetical protein